MQVPIHLGKMLLMQGILSCNVAHVQQQESHLTFLQASAQEWVSGVRGGGRSITYRLNLKSNTGKELQFDSLWVNGKQLPVSRPKLFPLQWPQHDTIRLVVTDFIMPLRILNNKAEEQSTDSTVGSVKAPIEYKGAALLSYKVDGSVRYFQIPAITVLSPIYGQ